MYGGILIVDTIVQETAIQEQDPLCSGPHLKAEAHILIRSTGGGMEADMIGSDKISAVNAGPDGCGGRKEIRLLMG